MQLLMIQIQINVQVAMEKPYSHLTKCDSTTFQPAPNETNASKKSVPTEMLAVNVVKFLMG